ncbi:hypothetical protein [Streptomyces sp. NPDC102360]|uniref:hypothetical protein n=1 Tax=Streptomyces sp. NPDC102360 TaxID=3366160 RepID=UPI003827438F
MIDPPPARGQGGATDPLTEGDHHVRHPAHHHPGPDPHLAAPPARRRRARHRPNGLFYVAASGPIGRFLGIDPGLLLGLGIGLVLYAAAFAALQYAAPRGQPSVDRR